MKRAQVGIKSRQDDLKKCSKCKKLKNISEFYKDKQKKSGRQNSCKICHNIRKFNWVKRNKKHIALVAKKYYKKNKIKINKKATQWQKDNPQKAKDINFKTRLLRNYGITLEDYSKLLEFQNNNCAICKLPMKHPNVDHNHSTGETRALLCWQCNQGLGKFKDNIGLLQAAIEHLVNPLVPKVLGSKHFGLPGRIKTSMKRRKWLAKKTGLPIEIYYTACPELKEQ